jgi:hypothetical protein
MSCARLAHLPTPAAKALGAEWIEFEITMRS